MQLDSTVIFAIGIVLAWLAGIRAYLTVFGVGIAGYFGWIDLPNQLDMASNPWIIGISGVLAGIEFFADKIPGVDSVWDLFQTLLRVPAGAFLAAATMSQTGDLSTGALAAGAGVALTSHFLKSGTRALINTSPEPVTNWTASVGEDLAVTGGIALLFANPLLTFGVVAVITLLGALFIWWVWRKLFGNRPKPAVKTY